jgi:hypothetical protein
MDTPSPATKPVSIAVIGWSTVAASAIIFVVNIVSLASYSVLDLVEVKLDSPLIAQFVPESMKKMIDLYAYSRWWTWYGIVFFAFVFVAGIQFVRLRAWGRKAMEIACWLGIANAFVDTFLSYQIWSMTQETLTTALRAMGGGHSAYVNPLGFFLIILGFLLWIIPSAGLIIYLRRPIIKQFVSLN